MSLLERLSDFECIKILLSFAQTLITAVVPWEGWWSTALDTFVSGRYLLLLGDICSAGEAESHELKFALSSFPPCNCNSSSNSISGQQKHFAFSILGVSVSYFSSSETSADKAKVLKWGMLTTESQTCFALA